MSTMTPEKLESGPVRSRGGPSLGAEVLRRIDDARQVETVPALADTDDLTEGVAPFDFIGASN